MGNLLTTLLNSSGALRVYGQEFNVIQNNIANASTPGYVKQNLALVPLPFDPSTGLSGGVLAGPLLSSRSSYLEGAVRSQQELLGSANQRSADLGLVEPLFDLTAAVGIPNALNKFFGGFSQLAVNPNDAVARQSVIDQAGQVAQSFQQTAAGINQVASNVANQTRDTVAGINRIAGQIASINQQYRANAGATQDAGLDAQLNSALEELSQSANFTVIKTPDGVLNVYLGGQTPLVVGDHQFSVSTNSSAGQTFVRDSQGNDITSQITGGSLGALVHESNTTLPGYLASLNSLAQSFADTVNTTLAQGVDKNGAAPTTNLFTYTAAGGSAATLSVTNITADQIAAALPGTPGGNGNALAVAQLASAPSVGGFTFTQAFGNLGSQVGRDVSKAQQETIQYQDSVTQAQLQRQQQTGVSLDEEAAKLLQFQQAYSAMGKMISVLDSLTQTVIDLIH